MYLYVFKFNNHLTTVWHSTKTESKSLIFNKQVTRYFALPRQVTVSSTFIFKVWKHQLQSQNITVNWIILPVLIFKRLRYKIIYSLREAFSWKIKIPLCSQFLVCYEQESWKSINGGLCLRSFSFWILSYILTVLTCHKKEDYRALT